MVQFGLSQQQLLAPSDVLCLAANLLPPPLPPTPPAVTAVDVSNLEEMIAGIPGN